MSSLLRKELRALLPAWVGAVALVLIGAASTGGVLEELAPMGYLLGSFILGGLAFGHEYLNGTMPLALTQPVSRRQIYLAKMVVLALALGTLAVVSYWAVLAGLPERELPAPVGRIMAFLFLTPLLAGPAMTIATRSAIAGTVLNGAPAGFIMVAAAIVGVYRFGWDERAITEFQSTLFWIVVPLYWVLSAVWGWIAFMRLEAVEGGGIDFNPFARLRTPRIEARRVHPIAALVAKELHLQQMVFVVAAGYALVAGLILMRPSVDPRVIGILVPVTFMYAATLPILVGALASAEERQFGTHESQLLLPMAASRQWAVKVAVALTLSLVLAIGLPLLALLPLDAARLAQVRADVKIWPMMVLIIVVASGSLYVSTLTKSGIRAMVLAVPVLFGGLMILQWSSWLVFTLVGTRFFRLSGASMRDFWMSVLGAVLVACFLTLGNRNHRTSEVSFARAARQLPWVVALFVVASAVLNML